MSSCTFKRNQLAPMLNHKAFLILTSLLLSFHKCLVTASDTEVDDKALFTYVEGTSKRPNEWGKINSLCEEGKRQTPIDIPDQQVQAASDLGDLKWDYKPAPAVVKNAEKGIAMFLEVIWEDYAGKININGTDYNLFQCHWHYPSEHTINGSKFALEFHAVHNSSSGQAAVVAIMYEYGPPDALLAKMLPYIQQSIGMEEEKEVGIVDPGDIEFGGREYYRYVGSLTVPPCTEGVIWTIMKNVGTVSREQMTALRESVRDGFKGNTRPIQPLNGRPVWFYSPKDV